MLRRMCPALWLQLPHLVFIRCRKYRATLTFSFAFPLLDEWRHSLVKQRFMPLVHNLGTLFEHHFPVAQSA